MAKSQHTPAATALRELLVAVREERGLTQAELAGMLGKHQSFVAKIEVGERRLDVLEFCALAHAMGLAPEQLLKRVVAVLPSDYEV